METNTVTPMEFGRITVQEARKMAKDLWSQGFKPKEIKAQLDRAGYTSPTTNKPVTEATARYMATRDEVLSRRKPKGEDEVITRRRRMKRKEQLLEKREERKAEAVENKILLTNPNQELVDMLKFAVEAKLPPQSKVKMIAALLKNA